MSSTNYPPATTIEFEPQVTEAMIRAGYDYEMATERVADDASEYFAGLYLAMQAARPRIPTNEAARIPEGVQNVRKALTYLEQLLPRDQSAFHWDCVSALKEARAEVAALSTPVSLSTVGEDVDWLPMKTVPKHGRRIYAIDTTGKAHIIYANAELDRRNFAGWFPLPKHGVAALSSIESVGVS